MAAKDIHLDGENRPPMCQASDDSCSCRLPKGHLEHPAGGINKYHRCTCGHAWLEWPRELQNGVPV